MTKRQVQKQIMEARADLWDVHENTNRKRTEWLETNPQDIARTAGKIDWEKNQKTCRGWQKNAV